MRNHANSTTLPHLSYNSNVSTNNENSTSNPMKNSNRSCNDQLSMVPVYKFPVCDQKGHATWRCPDYVKLDIQRRQALVTEHQLCSSCLRLCHHTETCRSMRNCYYCQTKHHSMLCDRRNSANETNRATHQNGNTSATPNVTPRSCSKVEAISIGRSSALEANILSVVPTTYVIPSAHQHMRLDVVAVEIPNSRTDETKSIQAFYDTGLQMTLLPKLLVEDHL